MPRTLAQNAQYIAETIKPAIKQAIEDKGVTVPSTDSFLDYADRIGEISGGGSGYQLKDLPTGSIATVTDAAPLPLNALKVSVEAQQDLHGYDHPWVGGAGKNKLPLTVDGIKQANTDVIWNGNIATIKGVTFTLHTDNGGNVTKITANGTTTSSTSGSVLRIPVTPLYTYNGQSVTISTLKADIQETNYRLWFGDASYNTIASVRNGEQTFTMSSNVTRVWVQVTGGTITNLDVYPMLRFSTVSDATFEPYSNICPIEGWDSGEITVCDDIDNPTQTETWSHQFTDSQGDPLTCYGGEWDVVDGNLKPWQIYPDLSDFTFSQSPNGLYYWRIGSDIPYALNQSTGRCSHFKLPADIFVGVSDSTGHYILLMKNRVDEALSISTVAEFNTWLANQSANNTPVQLAYPLATPTTINQRPLAPRMLEGVNNIYADCGEVIEGEYFVDEGALDTRKVDYSIGSNTAVKVTDGRVLSGFASMSGYHSRPLDASGNWLDVDWSKDFEIGVAFKFTSLSANQAIFASADANRELVPTILWVASDATGQNQLRVLVSTDGSSWEVACITSFVPTINTFYFIKMKYESATKKCITQVTSDFIDWTVIENDTLATHPYYNGAGTAIGGRGGSSAWATNNLLIDTFNTYIKGDGVNWGAFTGAFPS